MHLYLYMRFILFSLLSLVIHTAANGQNIQRLWSQRNYDALFLEAHRADKMSGPDMLRVAQAAQHLNHDSTAIYILDLAIKKGYATDEHYYRKGISYAKGRFYLEAAESFHQALALRPNRLTYLMPLADSYYRGQMPDSAYAVFTRIHELFPEKDVATFMSCKILEEEEYYPRAIACFEEHIPELIEPGYKNEAREILAKLYWHRGEDSAAAIELFKELISENPDKIKNRLNLIQLSIEMKDWESIEDELTEIHRISESGLLPSVHYVKNSFPVFSAMGNTYRMEFYQVVKPNLKHNIQYEVYFITPLHGRPIGKWSCVIEEGVSKITGEGLGAKELTINHPLTLQEYYILINSIEQEL